MRALVLGDDTRSFLAVVRSLGRAGWEVDAAPYDFSSPALASRYLGKVHRIPPYSLSPDRWVEALATLAARQAYDLVIPCDDRAVVPLQRHAAAFAGTRLALPNDEAMAAFFDKEETRRLAASLGVPVAPGRLLASEDSAEGLAAEFGLPLALKPRSSYTLGQAGAKASVRIVRSPGALHDALAAIRDPAAWLVEGFFDGEGVGVSVLAEAGTIRLAFQHRRLAEASESGGSSSRVSEPLDPRLLAAAEAMAAATRLRGVAMFEFRRSPPTGAFILIEVNARFWGSLPLAVSAGADFPAAAAALQLGASPRPVARYRTGLVLRDLGGEYYRLLREAAAAPRGLAAAARLAWGLARLGAGLLAGRAFDSHSADDPEPFRRERRQLLAGIARAIGRRLPLAAGRRRARGAVRRLAERLGEGRREIVMLCHGNICRSPFAEQRLRSRAAAAGLPVEVVSAGTIGLEGRPSPDDAVSAARAWGADLGDHRSRHLDLDCARAAGAVIVFDEKNVDELRRLGLNGDINLIRLADLAGRREIGDPHGHGPDAFAAAYAQIDGAVETLVATLSREARR